LQPKTNTTQWLRPYSKSIRTLAIRAAEQAAITQVVERRVQEALSRSPRAGTPVDGTPRRGDVGASTPRSERTGGDAGIADARSVAAESRVSAAALSRGSGAAGRAPAHEAADSRAAQWREAWGAVLSGDGGGTGVAGGRAGPTSGYVADVTGVDEDGSDGRGVHARSRDGGQARLAFVEAQSMLAAGAREAGAAYNTYEGFVEPLPSSAMAAKARTAAGARNAKERDKSEDAPNRRGSPEAIEKRRVARVFNDILGGSGSSSSKLDGRTEKRRQRLLKELEAGKARGTRELKPLDVLQRVQELMDLGEPLGSIRKVAKVKKNTVPTESIVSVVERLHKAYNFRPEVYRFVGIDEDVLRDAGVLDGGTTAASPGKKPAAKRPRP